MVLIKHKLLIYSILAELCLVQIQELQNAGLISRNPQNELDVQTTSYGKLMAKYYLCFETMKHFRQVSTTRWNKNIILHTQSSDTAYFLFFISVTTYQFHQYLVLTFSVFNL